MNYLCINLPDASDRRAHCESEFARHWLDVKFVRAYDDRDKHLRHRDDWITKQVGVCISHITAVSMVATLDMGHTVIFEDDIKMHDDFQEKLMVTISDLPQDWDIACLVYFGGQKAPIFEHASQYWQVAKSGDIYGCAAYVINGKKGAEAVLSRLMPIYSHIDRMLWESCRDKQIKGYFIKNNFITQTWDFPSQIIQA